MKHSEKALQQSIVEVLEMHGWTVLIYAPPGARGPLRQIARLLTQYLVPQPVVQVILRLIAGLGGKVPVGHTDLLALKCVRYGGFRALFLEVKLPGKKPTPQQEEFMERMHQAGARAYVVISVEALLNLLWAVGDEVRVAVR